MLKSNLVGSLILSKIRGAFILIGTNPPCAVVLTDTELALYDQRVSVVGHDKANAYTFGHTVINALPCVVACMENIALNYTGAFEKELRAICARVALGQPIDDTDGGMKVETSKPQPTRPPSSAAQRAAIRAHEQAATMV